MTRDEKLALAKECAGFWLEDLDDGELNDILFTPTSYPLNLSGWARVLPWPSVFGRGNL